LTQDPSAVHFSSKRACGRRSWCSNEANHQSHHKFEAMCAVHHAGCVVGQQCQDVARPSQPRRRSVRSRRCGTAGTSWREVHQRLVELTKDAGHLQTERRQARWARQRHSALQGWQMWDCDAWEDIDPVGSTGGLGSTGWSSDTQLSLRALYPDGRPVEPHMSSWERLKEPAVQDLEPEYAPQLHQLLKDLSERIPHGSDFWDYRDVQSGQTVLHMAAASGLHSAVEALLRSGANPDLQCFRPVPARQCAPKRNFGSSIDYDLSSTGSSSASNATERQEWTDAYLNLLTEIDGCMDRSDVDGCTPLYDAVKNGHYDVVALLRLHGRADPNVPRADGITPSMLAVWMRRWDGMPCEDDRMFQALLCPMGELGGCRMSFSPLAALSNEEHSLDVARTTAEGNILDDRQLDEGLPSFTVVDVAVVHGMHSYVEALLDAYRCDHGQAGVDELVFTQNLAVEMQQSGSFLRRCPLDCAVDLCSIAVRSPNSFTDSAAVQSYSETVRVILEQISEVPSTVETQEAEETLMELANLYGSESKMGDLLRLFRLRLGDVHPS